jgi:hypothetical protein
MIMEGRNEEGEEISKEGVGNQGKNEEKRKDNMIMKGIKHDQKKTEDGGRGTNEE